MLEKLIEIDNYFHDESNSFENIFTLIIIKTLEDNIFIRPVGGKYGHSINEAVKEVDKRYPGCKIKVLTEECNPRYIKMIGNDCSRML